jgi:hypothetical protein
MLSIDALRLQLPAGFEHRAQSIIHLLGHELARMPMEAARSLPYAELSLEVEPRLPDRDVATRIATALLAAVGGKR